MSATKTEQIIAQLVKDAEKSNDPARLYEIAQKLQHQSAWNEASHVFLKARELQMQIEQVMK